MSIERLAVGPARARLRGPQRAWIVLVLALALSFAALPAAGAAPSRKRVQAFLLTSSPDSLRDLEAHAGSVGVVYPTWFDCRIPSGRIVGGASSSIASYASTRHIALMPRFNCQDGATVHRILTDPSLRAATLTRLTSIGTAGLVRGVCLDLENDGAEDREALSSFVAALAGRLHARHRRLAVVVDGVEHEDARISTGFYDDRALSAVADTVFVLAWGTHWEGSAPGPIASLGYVEGVARYVASLPNASRFVLGAPMYGLDWAGEGGSPALMAKAYQYDEVLALQHAVGATPHRDPATGEMNFTYQSEGVLHHVWYLDAHSVAQILRVGRLDGLAVGVWRLGMEDQRLWSSPGSDGRSVSRPIRAHCSPVFQQGFDEVDVCRPDGCGCPGAPRGGDRACQVRWHTQLAARITRRPPLEAATSVCTRVSTAPGVMHGNTVVMATNAVRPTVRLGFTALAVAARVPGRNKESPL